MVISLAAAKGRIVASSRITVVFRTYSEPWILCAVNWILSPLSHPGLSLNRIWNLFESSPNALLVRFLNDTSVPLLPDLTLVTSASIETFFDIIKEILNCPF